MASEIECWDDDLDFQGDITFGSSMGAQSTTNLSSRRSVSARSESNAAEEDWQVLLTPNDDNSTSNAISSAKHVGIPIPQNVPQSALLGGTIKRLGKPKTAAKKNVADEWGDDFDFAGGNDGGLKLKLGAANKEGPTTPNFNNNDSMDDDFDSEWAEGSLGIRHGGARGGRGRSSSISAIGSPSMSSMTMESDGDDDLGGLVLPQEPIDFRAKLDSRRQQEQEKELEAKKELPMSVPTKRIRPSDDDEDMLSGLELDGIDFVEHSRKRTLNRNVKIEAPRAKATPPRQSVTSLTFTDKSATSRIPRPSNSASKPSQLAPVYESANTQSANPPIIQRLSRVAPTTTSAQLLRSKRSAPVLGRPPQGLSSRGSIPFLPAGISTAQSKHVSAKEAMHFRQPSDHHERPTSPPARSFSRMSVTEQQRATPSRTTNRREGYAAPPLARVAASNQRIQVKKRVYGHGNELDAFDDLPTSATKESKFMKEPVTRGPPKTNTLRRKESRSNLQMHIPERSAMATPAPSTVPSTPGTSGTPRSLFIPRGDGQTPGFARDTAASRNAREQRLSAMTTASQPTLRRMNGPMLPSNINWKAQVAARSPHNSPTALRSKRGSKDVKKTFIPLSDAPKPKNEKGMVYNAATQAWEGNDHMVYNFPDNPSTATLPLPPTHNTNHSHHHHTNSFPTSLALGVRDLNTLPRHGSPPRPALISNVNQQRGPRIERGMVFDPERMKWLKVDPRTSYDPANPQHTPGSVSMEDDDDPFAGIDDLPDERSSKVVAGAGSTANKENTDAAMATDDWALGEEFDLGQRFIKRQRVEEVEWRKWCEKWFVDGRECRNEALDGWKWEIRRVAERYMHESR